MYDRCSNEAGLGVKFRFALVCRTLILSLTIIFTNFNEKFDMNTNFSENLTKPVSNRKFNLLRQEQDHSSA